MIASQSSHRENSRQVLCKQLLEEWDCNSDMRDIPWLAAAVMVVEAAVVAAVVMVNRVVMMRDVRIVAVIVLADY